MATLANTHGADKANLANKEPKAAFNAGEPDDGFVLCGWLLQSKTSFEVIGNLSDTVLCSACWRGTQAHWP